MARTISKKTFFVLLGCLIVIASVTFNVYFLTAGVSGFAIWDKDEAYLFIHHSNSGYYTKWIRYPLLVAAESIGVIETPVEISGSADIIHVTALGVEHHTFDLDPSPGGNPDAYTPLEGKIWAQYPMLGGLCWWAGDHFEPATPEEQHRLGRRLDRINHVEDGWHKESIGGHDPGPDLTVSVTDRTVITIFNGNDERDHFSVQMNKPSEQATTSLFEFQRHWGLTSRSNYQRAFPNLSK